MNLRQNLNLRQGCTEPVRKVALANKFFTVTSNNYTMRSLMICAAHTVLFG